MNKPWIRRRWMVVAVMALITLPFVFLFSCAGPVGNPDVTATFTGFSNSALGKVAMFEFTNPSALRVRVESYVVPGAQHYRLHEVWPRKSVTVPVELPTRRHVPLTNAAPVRVTFHLRRQDTSSEEAREMLDSVLNSIGVAMPGLNPDSAQNKFEIVAEFPGDF